MIIDALGTLSDAQALTASAASTNIMDFGSDRDMGRGKGLCVLFTIDVAADYTTTDETYTFTLQSDDNAGFASPKNIVAKVFATLPSTPPTEMTAGSKWVLAIPADTSAERYLRVNYTLAGTTPSVTVTAQVQPLAMVQQEAIFPSGYVAA